MGSIKRSILWKHDGSINYSYFEGERSTDVSVSMAAETTAVAPKYNGLHRHTTNGLSGTSRLPGPVNDCVVEPLEASLQYIDLGFRCGWN